MNTTHTTCSCGCTGGHACDCCTGPHVATPQLIFNPSGLSAIQRRAGTWGSFRSTMQARLSSIGDFPALKNLTTREPDDPSIAFLDAAAVVCDVLTFYSERFANEGYLRTATQRRSLMELGKLVGYRPRPGVAASAWLAFTLDTDYAITIPAGTRVQSVPSAPGETAQTFETSGDLTARHELNAMPVRQSVPQEISPANVLSIETLYFKGTGLNLKAGDMLLFVFPDDEFSNTPRKVHTVTEDSTAQRTGVKLVVEKLSAAYYKPVLRKSAQALRRFLPESAVGTDTWSGKAIASLDRFSAKLGEDTSLLDIEDYFLPDPAVEKDTGLGAVLDVVKAEGDAAKVFNEGLPKRAAWTTDLRAGLNPILQRAATQEALLLDVFKQLLIIDDTASQINTRKAAATEILRLLDPGADGKGAIESCFQPVLSTLRTLRTDANTAKVAVNDDQWNAAGIGPSPNKAKRAAVDALGYEAGGAETARTTAISLLATAKTKLADDGTAPNAAGALFNANGGTLLKIINAAATPQPIKELLTLIKAGLDAAWTPLETTMSEALKAGTATDPVLTEAATKHAGLVADLIALPTTEPDNFNARATAMVAMANASRARYEGTPKTDTTEATPGIKDQLAFISSAGTQAATLLEHRARIQDESVAGLKSSILLLTGRYEKSVTEIPEVATALGTLETEAGMATKETKLAVVHALLAPALKAVDKQLATATNPILERLRAELNILSGQVSVSPSGASSDVGEGTAASGAALGKIVTASTLKQPAAPGNPLAVERSLGAFVSGSTSIGGGVSDAVSRLAGKLAGSTDDELFAAWRKLNTGAPAVEIYALRVQTAVFGAGAPMRFGDAADKSFDARFTKPGGDKDWTPHGDDLGSIIRLDGEQNKVVRESYVVIERPYSVEVKSGPDVETGGAPGAGLNARGIFGNATFAFVLDGLENRFLANTTRKLVGSGNFDATYLGSNQKRYIAVTETRVHRVQEVISAPHSAYSLSGKATTVSLLQETEWGRDAALGFGVIRGTKVYAASELLTIDEQPVAWVTGLGGRNDEGVIERSSDNPFSESVDILMLDGLYQGLAAGHRLIISGDRSDLISARPVREYALVSKVEHVLIPALADPLTSLPGDTPHTRITLSEPLQYQYQRSTVTVYGNVAEATHGETKRETLGGGNARAVSQRFAMRSVPLTYVAAATASGAESTAELRVDRVLWKEVEQFTNAGPDDRVYLLDIADDGTTHAVFGDGKQGARLPTGAENVAAVYRQGIGQGGNVGAESLSTVLDRPLGLKGVINPLAASGGADRDSAEDIRTNAPLPLMALDRLVSVSDYGAFSRAFAGIGKAEAALLGGAGGSFVHVTIAGQDDALVSDTSSLMTSLTQALITLGDPLLPVRVQSRELLVLLLSAGVRIAPEYAWADVEPALRAALLAAFGFARRAPGQDVFLSEVIAVMQRVTGVDFVDVDSFGGIPEKKAAPDGRRALTPEELETEIGKLIAAVPQERVAVGLAGWDTPVVLRPAQLALFLSDMPETLTLNQIIS